MTDEAPDQMGGYDWQADCDRLVDAILPHVPFDGWSDAAFKAGAADAAIDLPRALNAFPGGMAEVLAYNHRRHDQAMIDRLAGEGASVGRMRDRIAKAVRLRLELRFSEVHRDAASCLGIGYGIVPFPAVQLVVSGTTLEDVRLVKSLVGDRIRIKASGGIRSLETLLKMYQAGARRFGVNLKSGVMIVAECLQMESAMEC